MKALTVRQPWAALITDRRKRIEHRTWTTSYRGPLAIHAGLNEASAYDLRRWGLDPHVVPYGAIVAVTVLHDVQPYDAFLHASAACLDERPRDGYAWRLTDTVALPTPIPAKGAQGLWSLRDDLKGLLQVHRGP